MTDNKKNEDKTNKKRDFWKKVEDKVFDFAERIIEKGVVNYAVGKIEDAEDKIKKEMEKKYKKYLRNFLKIFSLVIASSFVFYGLLSLLMIKISMAEYTNLVFGLIFLFVYLILSFLKD